MRICKVKDCKKKYYARNFCLNHYRKFMRYGNPLYVSDYFTPKFCKIKNCGRKHYAKKYCKKHWAYYINSPRKFGHLHKCRIKNCQKKTMKEFCQRHKYRIKHNLPLNLSIKITPKGKRNVNWKGGIGEYPNHYLMKKNRLIILMHNPKCEKCRKPATEIHHKDGNKANHKLFNLMAVCHKCNTRLRTRSNIRFLATYRITKKEIAKKLKINLSQCVRLHMQNKLDLLLLKK